MKKILLLSLLISPLTFLTSCSGKYEVNKQEFNDAMTFKNVQYLQVDSLSKDVDHHIWNFSPTVFHDIDNYYEFYHEYYCQINNNTGYERDSESDQFKEFTTDSERYFKTPSEECNLLEQLHKEYEIEIDDIYQYFTFENNYYVDKKYGAVKIQFKDKKVISYVDNLKGDDTNMTFTYKEVTPDFPPSPLTLTSKI